MERTFLLSALNYHKKPYGNISLSTSSSLLAHLFVISATEEGGTNKTFVNGMNLIKSYVTHAVKYENILLSSLRNNFRGG